MKSYKKYKMFERIKAAHDYKLNHKNKDVAVFNHLYSPHGNAGSFVAMNNDGQPIWETLTVLLEKGVYVKNARQQQLNDKEWLELLKGVQV
jgi:hypothetical protein